MKKIIKGIKALLGFPFYVYKSYQILDNLSGDEFEANYLIDIKALQSVSDFTNTEAIYHNIFVKEVNRIKLFRENPVILDCGAHIGMFSIYYKYLYP